MDGITAFLIVRDEERTLPRCLDSLAGVVDEVVVLDTGSRDGTPALLAAEAARGRFRRFRWRAAPFAGFGPTRQAALDLVETEWALWIDADEALSPALRERLGALRGGHAGGGAGGGASRGLADGGAGGGPDADPGAGLDAGLAGRDGWEILRLNRVLGRVMRGRNLAGQYCLRLFRADRGRLTDDAVHEGIVLAPGARLGRLDEPLLHETMPAWRPYLAKVDLYTTLAVAAETRRFDALHLLAAWPSTFLRHYVGRGGWRDGWPGFVWAATSGWSSLLRDLKRARRDWRRWLARRRPSG